jgi:hypothetical protein
MGLGWRVEEHGRGDRADIVRVKLGLNHLRYLISYPEKSTKGVPLAGPLRARPPAFAGRSESPVGLLNWWNREGSLLRKRHGDYGSLLLERKHHAGNTCSHLTCFVAIGIGNVLHDGRTHSRFVGCRDRRDLTSCDTGPPRPVTKFVTVPTRARPCPRPCAVAIASRMRQCAAGKAKKC